MSDSTSKLTRLTTAQAGKEVTVNELFDAASPSMIFGRRQSSSGLNWDYFGGSILVNGVFIDIPNGALALTANTTNYIQVSDAGIVSVNITGTLGNNPLFIVITGASTVTSYIDLRLGIAQYNDGILRKSLTSDANYSFSSASEWRNNILEFTSSVSLTATRNIVIPLTPKQFTVFNNTTGGQSLQFIGSTGTGVTVAAGKRAIIYADGTNIFRVTADQ